MTKNLLIAAVAVLLGAQDSPFNGKDLTGWKFKGSEARNKWKVGKAVWDKEAASKLTLAEGDELVNVDGKGVDLYTEAKWGDAVIEVEVLVPKGSNSGVYVMGEYEVQIYDTFDKKGKDAKPGDMGGIYTFAAPKVFADKGPGVWQKFVIDFQAPKFEGGKKVSNAKFVKVTFNGEVIHENVVCKNVTPGGLTGKEMAEGPLMFQGDHGQVAFRNIRVTAKK